MLNNQRWKEYVKISHFCNCGDCERYFVDCEYDGWCIYINPSRQTKPLGIPDWCPLDDAPNPNYDIDDRYVDIPGYPEYCVYALSGQFQNWVYCGCVENKDHTGFELCECLRNTGRCKHP